MVPRWKGATLISRGKFWPITSLDRLRWPPWASPRSSYWTSTSRSCRSSGRQRRSCKVRHWAFLFFFFHFLSASISRTLHDLNTDTNGGRDGGFFFFFSYTSASLLVRARLSGCFLFRSYRRIARNVFSMMYFFNFHPFGTLITPFRRILKIFPLALRDVTISGNLNIHLRTSLYFIFRSPPFYALVKTLVRPRSTRRQWSSYKRAYFYGAIVMRNCRCSTRRVGHCRTIRTSLFTDEQTWLESEKLPAFYS